MTSGWAGVPRHVWWTLGRAQQMLSGFRRVFRGLLGSPSDLDSYASSVPSFLSILAGRLLSL